jgi:glycosyltransferase involved in cell wall biosynthesis
MRPHGTASNLCYRRNVNPRPRFSIIVPAHDEGSYLGETLEHIVNLSYPGECYEAIVVENGSTDDTLAVAKRFEGPNIRVFSSEATGVSAAKNFGIDQASTTSDWLVFLDADTVLEKDFLNDLAAMVHTTRRRLAVGTTSIRPLHGNRRARIWFAYYDVVHRFQKSSYAIQIARRSLFPGIRFDERLAMGEDLLMMKQARESGEFFFLPTRTVLTSTRRFDAVGYWRLFFHWNFVSNLPQRRQEAFAYEVVR